MPTPLKLYVGCSLTHAPEGFKNQVEQLKAKLSQTYEILEFIGAGGGTAQDVYRWDIGECVAKCDVFVAICDFPALGLGYEIATAVEKLRKPVLAVAHADAHVTRLILGVDVPHYEFQRYRNLAQVPQLLEAYLARGVN